MKTEVVILTKILEFLDFIHRQVFVRILKNITFRELGLFPFSYVGHGHLICGVR
jgi:hypothetical protein